MKENAHKSHLWFFKHCNLVFVYILEEDLFVSLWKEWKTILYLVFILSVPVFLHSKYFLISFHWLFQCYNSIFSYNSVLL